MIVKRSNANPILKPNKDQPWEASAVFNGCPVKKDNQIYLLYRAMSLPRYHSLEKTSMMVSCIGIAQSKDGVQFESRRRFIIPEHTWENFGCEDPRVTKFNNKYYIFYTALSAYPPGASDIRVGLAISKDLNTIEEKHSITPFNAKAMALFPETIKGKILAVLTVHTDSPPAKICLASFDTEEDIWSESYWQEWYKNFDKYSLPIQRRLEDHIEVGAPPIKTIEGWLLIHSYIRNYFSPQRFFTIEAVLLDSNDPFKIIARTEVPILTPGEYYEKIGLVPNVVFPSGAVVKRDWIYLYYGAADTTCCLALIKTSLLLDQMFKKGKKIVILERAKENPIITPDKKHSWESKATFNPAALYLWGKVHVVYRAMSEDNTSVFGYASTKDGVHIDYRSPKPIYTPRVYFEKKLKMGANSGCEDPRLTKIEGKIYMCYTAFDGKSPTTVALTWITVEDFLAKRWRWAKPQRISPPGIDNKDALIFPEKFNGKYIIVHRCGDDIDLAFSSTLNFKGGTWDEIYQEYCWIAPRRELWDSKKVGAAAPPVKTKEGWVLLYHGFSERNIYRVGAVLLDPRNPTKIIGRTSEPILKPEAPYEKEGLVPNVVFPCGAVLIGKKLFVYYGAADKVIGVAKIRIIELLKALKF